MGAIISAEAMVGAAAGAVSHPVSAASPSIERGPVQDESGAVDRAAMDAVEGRGGVPPVPRFAHGKTRREQGGCP